MELFIKSTMIVKYQGYWAARKSVQKPSHSVSLWDTWNKTKYEKKVEKGTMTSKEVAEENHKNNLGYEASIFENEGDEYPYVFFNIIPKSKHVGISFIDPAGREYLTYSFSPSKKVENKIFLREIWFYEYAGEETDNMKSRTHFVFDEEGNVSYRVYDMLRKKTLDYETKEPINTDDLYEDYPSFGEYEGITRLERFEGIDFMLPFRGQNPATYVDTYDGRSLKKTNTPYHKLEEDEQKAIDDAFSLAAQEHKNGTIEKAIHILEKALEGLPAPKENFKAAGDIVLKIADYQADTKNFDAAFKAIDSLEAYLNADNYDAIALYKAKIHYLSGDTKKAFDLFQSFKIRKGMEELRKRYPEYNAIFQKLL